MKEIVDQVFLIRTKEDFKSEVNQRLEIGQKLLNRQISDGTEKENWWDEFIDWNSYNEEMIKQAFDKPNNTYFDSYRRKSSVGAVFAGEYKKPSFTEEVEGCREEMSYQVRRLKRLSDKIGLLRISSDPTDSTNINAQTQLINLLNRFHKVAQELRDRREDRPTLIISDEHDVQDLLRALLRIYFLDVRIEEFSPSNSGSNSRLDFVLKDERTIIETKMTSPTLTDKKLGEELLVDIGRYKSYPDCETLILFIYDKGDHVRNKWGMKRDLEGQSTKQLKIVVIIVPD